MIFPKDEGVGDGKSGKKFELDRAPILQKHFLNFLGKKTPKTATFPSCDSVSPSLTIWIEQNVFGKPKNVKDSDCRIGENSSKVQN